MLVWRVLVLGFLVAPVLRAATLSVHWLNPPPPSLTAGQTFQVSWAYTGSPDHSNVHWHPSDPTSNNWTPIANSIVNASADLVTGSTQTLTAPTTDTNGLQITQPTLVKYVAHVRSGTTSAYSAVIDVVVNPILSATWITPPPSTLTTGQVFEVRWSYTGTPDHMNVHWNPSDPTAIDPPTRPNSTAYSSPPSTNGSSISLIAPVTHLDGTPITCPTLVRYVVHVLNSLAANYSSIIDVTVRPPFMSGFPDVVLDYFDSGAGPIPGPYGGYSLDGGPVPVRLDVVLGGDPCPQTNSLSLPTGSYVTVGFTDDSITNGPGADFFVTEVGEVMETANVYVSSNFVDFAFAGVAYAGTNTGFDLGQINFPNVPVVAVKVVGLSTNGTHPGFDLVGITISPTSIGPPSLGPRPPQPLVVVTNREPAPNLLALVSPSSTQLKVFTGSSFTTVNATNVDRSRRTIVMTHGWISSSDAWPVTMAAQLVGMGISANILAWDWREAADTAFDWETATYLDLNLALARTCAQGEGLGGALFETLGTNYDREIHFIGHSLGTLVNAGAADYLHGDASSKPPRYYDAAKTHVTLLDDAEIAKVAGIALNVAVQNTFGLGNSIYDRKVAHCTVFNPIPIHRAWIDNYFTFAGTCHPEAVNVFLQRGLNSAAHQLPFPIAFLEAWHEYPHEWYGGTVTNPAASELGHRWSFERNGVPAPAYTNGSVLLQQEEGGSQFSLIVASEHQRNQICSPRIQRTASFYAEESVRGGFRYSGRVIAATFNLEVDVGVGSYSLSQNVLDSLTSPVVNVVSDWLIKYKLKKRREPSGALSPGFAAAFQASSGNTPRDGYVWIPLSIPTNAVGFSFQFRFLGVGAEDFLSVGISNTPLLMLESRFLPDSNWVTTGVLDISRWAGQAVELFLGYSGTSTNEGAIEVQALQFFTLQGPGLSVAREGVQVIVSWPASAIGFQLESAAGLGGTNMWRAVTNAPVFNLNTFVATNDVSASTRFYRLRKP